VKTKFIIEFPDRVIEAIRKSELITAEDNAYVLECYLTEKLSYLENLYQVEVKVIEL
jgi:hypothetical protein